MATQTPVSWTEGYITEVEYTRGFYRELSPGLLSFAAGFQGYDIPRGEGAFSLFELGCGHGFSAAVIAAANPEARIWANDFNPAHIRRARGLAEEAGLKNVTYLEKSFAELLEMDFPEFDFITLHGVYSWVSAENRRHIIAFIRRHLKPGGVVYVSYNSLPGWTQTEPLRRLMTEFAGRYSGGRVDRRFNDSLAFVEAFQTAGASYFKANPAVGPRLDQIKTAQYNYLVHEYMNQEWSLFYFADVAHEMAGAKLAFAASANTVEQIEVVLLSAEVRELMNRYPDTVFRETLKDYAINQQFRRDIYVKGGALLTPVAHAAAQLQRRLALIRPRSECSLTVNAAGIQAALHEGIYVPILDRLAEGPASFGELFEILRPAGHTLSTLGQAAAILTGVGYAHPAVAGAAAAQARRPAQALNRTLVQRAANGDHYLALASPVIGSGIMVGALEQVFLFAEMDNRPDPAAYALERLEAMGRQVLKDGQPVPDRAAAKAELDRLLGAFRETQLPLFKALQIVGR